MDSPGSPVREILNTVPEITLFLDHQVDVDHMTTTPPARAENTPPKRDQKRPYVRPVLKTYGDLCQLTQAKGMTGKIHDGAHAQSNKTQ